MRKKIYNIIEPTKNITTIEKIYDIFMILVIIASLLPLTIKTHSTFYAILENVTTLIFIIDYLLRLMTADFKLKQGKISGNFFDALYWATISMTTVGYGDIYAVSAIGKLITMISSILGVAIIALPVSIMTAGYLEEIETRRHRHKH